MKQSIRRVTTATALAASLALVLAGCSSDSDSDSGDDSSSEESSESSSDDTESEDTSDDDAAADLSGNLAGAGASSQSKAEEGWVAGFMEANPGVQTSYDAIGSGGGREQFLSASVLFAGTDSLFSEEEIASASDRCFGGELIEVPVYISPIAVTYNLPDVGVDNLQLDGETIANIFAGNITTWDDAAIADQNPDATLPSSDIIVVNRSDDSGTTENFTEYLSEVAPDAWTYGAVESWPVESVQSGDGTSGVISTISSAEGTIGYADASQVADLGTVAVKVGENYVVTSPEAAALALDASPLTDDATDLRITYSLDRTTTEEGAYPLILISYLAACDTYDDAADAANVAAYFDYVTSEDGQNRASDVAGSAPISDDLRSKIQSAVATISAS